MMDSSNARLEIAVHATVGSFVARLRAFDLAITIDPHTGVPDSAVFRFDFASIQTGNAGRDVDMNQWQQTKLHPEVKYQLDALTSADGGRFTAHGRLQLHGVEHPVEFPVSIHDEGAAVTIDGQAAIDTRDYGLPVITTYFLLRVDPVVILKFHLQGRREPPAGGASP
jgi:polyisoprenoid-binding protein YceI